MAGGGDTITPISTSSRDKMKNVIDVVTELQKYSISDGNGEFNDQMIAWDQVIEIFSVGFKIFFASFFVGLILLPIAVAVNFDLLQVFGGSPVVYDKLYVFVVAFSLSFGAIVILVQSQKFSKGPLTYKIFKTLYFGAIMSSLLKGIILFIGFQIVASLITPQRVIENLSFFITILPNAHEIAASKGYEVSVYIVSIIKPIFRISAIIGGGFSLVTIILLIGILHRAKIRKDFIVKKRDYVNQGDS